MAEDTYFGAANSAVVETRNIVEDQIANAVDNAEQFRSVAEAALDQMASFRLPEPGVAPSAPTHNLNIQADFELPDVTVESFGDVAEPPLVTAPEAQIDDITDVPIDGFTPSITGISVPSAPVATAPTTAPDRPVLGDVTLPDAPVLVKPNFPDLADITIPSFAFPTLPTFTSTAPEFQGTAIAAVVDWAPDSYEVEVIDEVIEKLRAMWAGGTGLPAAVEQALFERAASREDLTIARDVSAAMTEFSSRGFTLPPGALVARVDAIREEGAIRKTALSREVYIKAIDTEIQNLRFACEQGVAAENVLFSIYNAIAQREFEIAKSELDARLALYNAQVALFNAQQSAYATEAQVFKTRLDGELARIEVFKAQLEGELARGQLNEQRVRIYSEQVRAVLTDIEVYKAQMEGASIQSGVIKNRIDAYRADVQAYSERIQADKVRFDAYKSQVDAEVAKTGIIDAEARAYAAYVQGQSAKIDGQARRVQAQASAYAARIQGYSAQLDQGRTLVTAQAQAIQARAAAYTAATSRYSAVASAEGDKARVEVAAQEAMVRTNLAIYETEVRRYIAEMEQMIRTASLQLEAIKSAGQTASTLAAGAMAGISIGASISGNGAVSATGSGSTTLSKSKTYGIGVSAESPTVPPEPLW